MNDSTLIREAWTNYKDRLLLFIRSKVSSLDDAEDILSLAFTKLIQQGANSELPKEIVPWLYRVIRNSITDYYRASRKFDAISDEFAEDLPAKDTYDVLSGCIAPMINVLSDPYHTVVKMSDIDRMKNREIAEKLDLSLSAVKSQVLRGRKKLYQKLALCCEVQRNTDGSVVDFEQKLTECCENCDE